MAVAPDRNESIARQLFEAEVSRRRIVPRPGEFDGLTLEDAYRIQDGVAALKKAGGLRHTGWKTMGTNAAIRERAGMTEPARGYLFAPAIVEAGAVDGEGHGAFAEPEIAFVMGRDLEGPGVTPQDVLGATREVCAAIEVAWSRIEGQTPPMAMIADNAVAARAVLSSRRFAPSDAGDLARITAILLYNGEVAGEGTGEEVYGSPANAVAWLANHLAQDGLRIEAGQVIISGSLTLPVAAKAGDLIEARFDVLGDVAVRIT